MLRFAPFPSFLELSKSLESGKKVRAEVLGNFWNFWKSMILDQSTCLWSLGSSSESDHRGISTDLLRIAESRDISRKSWISTPKSENINFSRVAYMFSYSWKKYFFCYFLYTIRYPADIPLLAKRWDLRKIIENHWKSMISTKSLDFMIFGSANTTESPPRPTG